MSTRFLIGKEGQDELVAALSAEDPRRVLLRFQNELSLDPSTGSRSQRVLKLLELLGRDRAAINEGLLEKLRGALSSKTADMPQENLSQLIQKSYPYVVFDELRPTVFDAMRRHSAIPQSILQHLLADNYLKVHRPDILSELAPIEVRQQLWACDPNHSFANMLQQLWTQYQVSRKEQLDLSMFEVANAIRHSFHVLSAMDSENDDSKRQAAPPASASELLAVSDTVEGTQLRLGATVDIETQKMDAERILGTALSLFSRRIFLRRKSLGTALEWFRREPSAACLRFDLLMAIHDADRRRLCESDPTYQISWLIDACLKDDTFDERRLKELDSHLVVRYSEAKVTSSNNSSNLKVTLKVATNNKASASSSGSPTTHDASSSSGMRLRSRSLSAATNRAAKSKIRVMDDLEDDDNDDSLDLADDFMDVDSYEDEDEDDEADYSVRYSSRRSKRRKLAETIEVPTPAQEESNLSEATVDVAHLLQDEEVQDILLIQFLRHCRTLSKSTAYHRWNKDAVLQRLVRLLQFPHADASLLPRLCQVWLVSCVASEQNPAKEEQLFDFISTNEFGRRLFVWCCVDLVLHRENDMSFLSRVVEKIAPHPQKNSLQFVILVCASLPHELLMTNMFIRNLLLVLLRLGNSESLWSIASFVHFAGPPGGELVKQLVENDPETSVALLQTVTEQVTVFKHKYALV